MLKTVIAASAALLAGGASIAAPVDPGFSQGTITRGDAFAIRSCGDAYGPREDVCYNQTTSGEVFPFSRGVGIEVTRNRVVRVDCDRRHVGSSTRAEIGREFCPAVEAGTLAPAPFLD